MHMLYKYGFGTFPNATHVTFSSYLRLMLFRSLSERMNSPVIYFYFIEQTYL